MSSLTARPKAYLQRYMANKTAAKRLTQKLCTQRDQNSLVGVLAWVHTHAHRLRTFWLSASPHPPTWDCHNPGLLWLLPQPPGLQPHLVSPVSIEKSHLSNMNLPYVEMLTVLCCHSLTSRAHPGIQFLGNIPLLTSYLCSHRSTPSLATYPFCCVFLLDLCQILLSDS